MAKQTINIGSTANDGTGSTLRVGGDLINDNFNEIYTAFGDGSTLSNAIPGKVEGANFIGSILVGHTTTGAISSALANTGVGIHSLKRITTGDNNTMIGYNSGQSIISGRHNTGLGKESANSITSGLYNINIGYQSGQNITSGDGNVIIGAVTSADSATGDRTLKIAGHDGTTTTTWLSGDSSGNLTTVGDVTLANNKKVIFGDAGENIVGDGTAMTIASSQNITLDAAGDITINADGSIISLQDGATEFLRLQHGGSNNSVIKNSNSDADILIKGSDGGSEITALTFDMSDAGSATFNNNVNVGGNATITGNLTVNGTTTTVNSTEVTIQNAFVFEGATADAHETTLTVVDPTADRTITLPDESGDVIIGKFGGTNFDRSLLIGHSTTGTLNGAVNNTGVGEAALEDITTGDDNTAIGRRSLRDLNSGGANTALGSGALQTVTSNSGNTGIGRSALSLTVGTNNIGLGLGAGSNITSGSGNIIIGADTNADSASGDRQLKIAGYDGTTTTTWISGDSSGVVTATLAANTITSTQLASATTLLILNSSGSTLKTIIGAGS